YTYFNNHPAGSAPANARQLAILLKQPLKELETINMTSVRKRAGEDAQSSLDQFITVPDVQTDDFVRYCSHCGEMVLKDDRFCEVCGAALQTD
ncbi:MAG: zinc-ribbon domain-containing protein, partial [Candidatus Hodarchaeales archaeon]